MFRHVRCRFMRPGEEDRVIRLVTDVFKGSVAPRYSSGGVHEFLRHARSDDLRKRSMTDHFVLVAESAGEIIAMIEVKKYHHISLFFVSGEFQRRGIGRLLLNRALRICRQRDPWLREISVNASPNAVGAYSRMGFVSYGAEMAVNGIRFIPMTSALKRRSLFRQLV